MQYVDINTLELVTRQHIAEQHPDTSLPPDLDGELLAELGFAVLEHDPHPGLEPGEAVEPGQIRMEDGRAIQSWVIIPAPEPEPVDWAAVIAGHRYAAETAGITITGMSVDTGRDSQALITGAALAAMLDPAYTCQWKTARGFVELGAEQIISVASAVRAHVQACFDREAELLAALDAGEFTPEMLQEGWPGESVPASAEG